MVIKKLKGDLQSEYQIFSSLQFKYGIPNEISSTK